MPDFSFEEFFGARRGRVIAGIDEVGRGPWAGPVFAAAVALSLPDCPASFATEIDDSKVLKASQRAALAEEIAACGPVGIGQASVAEIDALNILNASLLAMRRALDALVRASGQAVDVALVDGNQDPGLACATQLIVKGDARSISIAAASIVAKVTRDRLMGELALRHPGYGWEHNMGYGTKDHRNGLALLGPSPEHRRSFACIKQYLS
jgi:ribonuclease HII